MICPQCGFEQPEAVECARCGVVFSRYRAPATAVAADRLDTSEPAPAPAAFHDRLQAGAIVSEAFSIYFANFLPFFLISCVALSPRILTALVVLIFSATGRTLSAATAGCLPSFNLLVESLGGQVATAAVTYGVYQQLRGHEATVGDSLRVGLSSLGRVIWVGILHSVLIGLGLACFILPGVFLALRWAVAVPVTVEEKKTGMAALERSAELTAGCRREIFSILFVFGLLNIGLVLVLAFGLTATLGAPAGGVGAVAGSLLTTGLGATASAVLYYRLRSIKEAVDVHELASVFD